jgi:small subunit ribosomal protein S4
MTKRLESKFRICKKLNRNYNNIWGLPKGESLRSVKNERRKKKKPSLYGKLLGVKQSFRFFYCNLQEKSFKRLLKQSVESPLTTLDRFVSFLESRLDVVLFRSCFVSSMYKSRQLINHGNVSVNGKLVRNPGTNLAPLDLIEIDENLFKNESKIQSMSNDLKKNFSSRFLPSYLEVDYKTLTIIFLWDPNYKSTHYPIKGNYSIIQRFYR